MPNTGPKDGSRNVAIAFLPIFCKPCTRPMLVVDFPSPAGVGVIAVTNTNLPSGLSSKRRIASKEIFAL